MNRVLFCTTRQQATNNYYVDEPVQRQYGVAHIDAASADDRPSVSDVQYLSVAELLNSLFGDGPTAQSLVLFVHGLSTQFKRSLEQGFRIQQRLQKKVLVLSWPSGSQKHHYLRASQNLDQCVQPLRALLETFQHRVRRAVVLLAFVLVDCCFELRWKMCWELGIAWVASYWLSPNSEFVNAISLVHTSWSLRLQTNGNRSSSHAYHTYGNVTKMRLDSFVLLHSMIKLSRYQQWLMHWWVCQA